MMAACYDPAFAEEMNARRMCKYIISNVHDTYFHTAGQDESILSDKYSARRRITDGTSDMEIYKAMSTYLNMTAGTDYNLPVLIGEHSKLMS